MIYCVVPPELADELYERLVAYYKENPNVEVIVDRRSGPDRRQGTGPSADLGQRQTRDRRRPRAVGTFPSVDPPSS